MTNAEEDLKCTCDCNCAENCKECFGDIHHFCCPCPIHEADHWKTEEEFSKESGIENHGMIDETK